MESDLCRLPDLEAEDELPPELSERGGEQTHNVLDDMVRDERDHGEEHAQPAQGDEARYQHGTQEVACRE